MIRFSGFVFLSFFLLVSPVSPVASTARTISDPVPVNVLFERLEQKYSVIFFFQEDWFRGKTYPSHLVDLPLEEAVSHIISGLNLGATYIDGYVAIVHSAIEQGGFRISTEDLITIGNPLLLGRQRFAIVSGTVLDGNTGEPLFGAVIFSEDTGEGATAGIEGSFTIRLPVGQQRIRISYVGYEESYWRLMVASDGEANFELFQQATALDPFTLTAKRAEEQVRSLKMGMLFLDSKTLKALPGSFGEPDIVRSVTFLPGVQTVGEFGTGFNVRGGGSDQNLVLLEGVPLFNASHLFGLISVVNSDMVNNVTLMKAGIPASFGERASAVMDVRMSGVIPERISIRGGIGLLNSRLHFQAPLFDSKSSLSLGGRSSYSNWILRNLPDAELMNSDANFYDLSGVFTTRVGKNGNLTLFGYQSTDHFLYGGVDSHAYSNRLASIRWDAMIGPDLYSRLSYGISQYQNQVLHEKESNPRDSYRLDNSLGYQSLKWHLDLSLPSGATFEAGLQGILNKVYPGEINPVGEQSVYRAFSLEPEQGVELAAFFSSRFDLNQRLGMEVGLRGVHFSLLGPGTVYLYDEQKPRLQENITDSIGFGKNETIWSQFRLEPRVNFRYLLDETSSLKLSYSRHNQFIQLVSNTAVMAPSDIWKLSGNYFEGMRADQFALGYYRNFSNHTIETSVEAYYKIQNGLLDYRNGARIMLNPFLETDLVPASGYSYGIELFVQKKTGRLTGWFGYTYSRSMRRTREVFESHMVNQNKYFPSIFDQPNNLNLNANYYLSRRWRISATFTYNTGRPATYPELVFNYQGHEAVYFSERNKYRLPDYHRLDLAISFGENLRLNARGKGSWTLSLLNVYGRKNPFSVFYEKSVANEGNDNRRYSLYKLYIIGRPLPVLTYNFLF